MKWYLVMNKREGVWSRHASKADADVALTKLREVLDAEIEALRTKVARRERTRDQVTIQIEDCPLVAELQAVWQGIGPDALQSAGEDCLDAEQVRELVHYAAEAHLPSDICNFWVKLSPDATARALAEAFPEGQTYGY